MADVKWIKLQTDIFDHRKIRHIETMPEGDAIIVIWLNILCLAGNSNRDGMIYFTEEIPYTEEMLVTEFRRPAKTVQLALMTFRKFGMIETIDDIICISNWEKYQSADKLAAIREQTRLRVEKHRNKKAVCNAKTVTQALHVTDGNATELRTKNLELRTKNIESSKGADAPTKTAFGEYGWIKLTDAQHNKFIADFGESEFNRCVTHIDESAQSTGNKNKWKDWNLVLRRCQRDKWGISDKKQPDSLPGKVWKV